MELIQNADDNHYESQTPELSLTLSGRHLHIACNETGFTEGNINAISRIHKSTKTNDKSGEGYVGEKGIGFKSVFKVADVVWISSGYYSFKFDKRATLGMVTPIWDAFPVNTRPGYTEFYLQLSEDTDVEGIKKELLSLQPSLLLFLRRLHKINIDAPGHPRISLSCAQTSAEHVLSCNGKSTEYVVHQHLLSNMPREERRPGIASTRILLAFPMNEDHEPIVTDQDVFAFLPIRSYGFKVGDHTDSPAPTINHSLPLIFIGDLFDSQRSTVLLISSIKLCLHAMVTVFDSSGLPPRGKQRGY